MKMYNNIFENIVSPECLFLAWTNFVKDKKNKPDVMRFGWKLEENVFQLSRELKHQQYKHGKYTSFYVTDPKQRHIHKAEVRDRVLHHAVVSILTPIFEPTFISNSFSCQQGKGTHKGVLAVERMARKVSKNSTRPCYALKCDVKKFFDSVNHNVLLGILSKRVKDENVMWLMHEIVGSFISSYSNLFEKRGIPIGNLTSQLFANIYMNEFDQFVKQKLKIKYYARYTDDFIILSDNFDYLENLLKPISRFLIDELKIEPHPKKTSIRKFNQGIDFLGYIIFPHHRLLRTRTRKRIERGLHRRLLQYNDCQLERESLEQLLNSYWGVFCHCNAYIVSEKLINHAWFVANPDL